MFRGSILKLTFLQGRKQWFCSSGVHIAMDSAGHDNCTINPSPDLRELLLPQILTLSLTLALVKTVKQNQASVASRDGDWHSRQTHLHLHCLRFFDQFSDFINTHGKFQHLVQREEESHNAVHACKEGPQCLPAALS